MTVTTDLVNTFVTRSDEVLRYFKGNKKARVVSISAAVVFTLTYSLFQKLNKPPKNLRHLPYIGFFQILKYFFSKRALKNYPVDVMNLTANSNGLYMRPSPFGWALFVADPITLKSITTKPETAYPKIPTYAPKGTVIDRFIGGHNLIFSTGERWRRQKKIINPGFQRAMPVQLMSKLTLKLIDLLENLDTDEVNITEYIEKWALDVVGNVAFDFDFNALGNRNNRWVRNYDAIKKNLSNPFFILFPQFDTKYLHLFKDRKKIQDQVTEFKGDLKDLIHQRRAEIKGNERAHIPSADKDLLTLFIESEMDEGAESLSTDELMSNLCVFFLAGHDTTATSLTSIFYELGKNQHYQDKAREEVLRVFGDSNEDIIPTPEQLKQLPYVYMVIKEGLRRHPPVYNVTARKVIEDTNLAGHFIPKGTEMTYDIYNIQHNSKVWKNPNEFIPERFAPGGEADSLEGVTWLPFSSGQRQCVGINLSLAEQRILLAMFLRKYTWTIINDNSHLEISQTSGVSFGLVVLSELNIKLTKRY